MADSFVILFFAVALFLFGHSVARVNILTSGSRGSRFKIVIFLLFLTFFLINDQDEIEVHVRCLLKSVRPSFLNSFHRVAE